MKPTVKVELIGHDGNAFAILGKVKKALREAKYSNEEIEEYLTEAMSGDYDNLLRVTSEWVDIV